MADVNLEDKITVLVVEPEKNPYKKEISNDLKSLQHEVGGYIECVYPFEEPVAIVVNEEGKLDGLPFNRALRDGNGEIYDIVAGTFLIVGLTEEDFGSLSEDLIQQFSDYFSPPEVFLNINGKCLVMPMPSEIDLEHKPSGRRGEKPDLDKMIHSAQDREASSPLVEQKQKSPEIDI